MLEFLQSLVVLKGTQHLQGTQGTQHAQENQGNQLFKSAIVSGSRGPVRNPRWNNIFSPSVAKFDAFGATQNQSAQNCNAWHLLSEVSPSAGLMAGNRLDRKQKRVRSDVWRRKPSMDGKPVKADLTEATR
jgi:hypothetical protein